MPGRGFGDDDGAASAWCPTRLDSFNWTLTADEYHGANRSARALVRYPLRVRLDIDPDAQSLRLALDC